MKFKNSFWSCAALVAALTGNAEAQFNYNSGDVLVCFRNTSSQAYDLIVDAGPVSTFASLPIGDKITITTDQLGYAGTNNVAWCVCAATDNSPVENTWLTKPRDILNTQTSPLNSAIPNQQRKIAGDIDGYPSLSADVGSYYPSTDLLVNSATEAVETEAGHQTGGDVTGNCYAYWVEDSVSGSLGNAGNFRGDAPAGFAEQTTPANFSTAGQPVRADFYQLLSNNSTNSSTYLGYFEFSTNGVMTYTSGPSAAVVAAPTITSFTRSGTTNIITFTTVIGGTYNLIATNNLTIPAASWPVIGSSVAGDGSPKSITNVTADALNYYRISAH
jgi:hypothetical protein